MIVGVLKDKKSKLKLRHLPFLAPKKEGLNFFPSFFSCFCFSVSFHGGHYFNWRKGGGVGGQGG
jgi:hypothetical protein